MGRRRSSNNEINKGTWSKEEDEVLFNYVTLHGEGKWREVAQCSGLKRDIKSCRYRYLNYLKPGIKRGDISMDEQDLIIRLQRQLGNRWAMIAKGLPGRTDIEIKNYWKIYLSKKLYRQHKPEEKKTIDDFILNNIDQNDQIGNIVNDLNSKIQQIEEKNKEEKEDRHGLKGAWSRKEDEILYNYIALHGEGQWEEVAQRTGLKRNGKSCRHRYLHYLKPGIKRGNISKNEEDMIIRLHHVHGNRWTSIAKNLPGRTDSEIKNYWHAYLSKKLEAQPKSRPSSPSLEHYQHKPEDKNAEQVNSVYAPAIHLPTSTNAQSLEDKIVGSSKSNDNTNMISPSSFQIEYDDAFCDDFLFNIFQNDQIGDDLNIKIPLIEDHDMVSSSSFTDHECQLSENVWDFWTSSGFPLFD